MRMLRMILLFSILLPLISNSQQVLPYLTKEHKYRFVNEQVRFVSNQQYDWVYMHSTKGYWHARRGDISVVVSPDGREVYQTNHRIESLYPYNDIIYIRTYKPPFYGLVELQSGKHIPEEWDDFYQYQQGDPIVVKKNNKLGIRTLNNQELIPARHDNLRLFNGKFVLYYQDKHPVIANIYSGDTLSLSFPEAIQYPEYSSQWIRFKGKEQSYVSSFAALEQKKPMIRGDNFIYWDTEHILVIRNGQAALYDTGHRILQKYPVTLKAPFQYRLLNNSLVFYNGNKCIYIDQAGHTDSIPVPAGNLGDDGAGYIISPSDPPGFHYALSDNRVVLKEYLKSIELPTARLELKGTRFSVYDKRDQLLYQMDSVSDFYTLDSFFVNIICNDGNRCYNLRSGKTFSYTDGFLVPVKIGDQYFCKYNKGDLYIYYDAGFTEVKRITSNETPRLFGRFIGENRSSIFSISDFFTGQLLPVTTSGNNTVMYNELPYILISDTYNYYINRNGKVLKEEK